MPITAFSSGPKYPTTTTTLNGTGNDSQWANPANIFADDAANATSAFFNTIFETQELNGATLGFVIPSNTVIDGIKLEMEVPSSNRWSEGSSTMKLKKAGVLVGNNKAGTGSVSSGVYSYGSSTDLWGTTWTAAEINATNFGFGFVGALTSSPNDFSIAVDFVRITVYWHYSVDVSPADVPKRYLYKVFNDGAYLGNLPKVTSKFGYSLDINSVGSSLNIECGVSADTSSQAGSRLVTEAGDPITTENNEYIYTDGQPPIISVGSAVDPTIIQNGNRIEVWEYGYYHPNGKLLFRGQVNRIEAGFGAGADNKIKLLVLSDGIDLTNYIARGSPFSYTNDVSQTSNPNYVTVTAPAGGWQRYGQTFVIGAGVTKLGAIRLYVNGVADATISLYASPTDSIAIGSVTQSVNTAGIPKTITFGFASLLDVVPGGTYFFAVSVAAGQALDMGSSIANPYANGSMYSSSYGGGSGGGGYVIVANNDLYFITASGLATTTATYTSKDPSTEMLKPIIDDYRVRGGRINYATGTVDATGLSLTATFNTETITDALKKVLSLAQSGYYFYVDLGTNTLYFKNTLTTATYKLIKGRHLHKIYLTLSIENVKNDLLFSGAETAGTNLFTQYEDQTSQSNYGRRLERKSDNRVSIQNTADAVGSSFIAENKDEYYETPVTVLDRTMDITLLRPGQTVGLRGFGSFIDRLTLQIVRIEYQGELANLVLGNMPKRFSAEFEKVIRGLAAEQTVANPSAPS